MCGRWKTLEDMAQARLSRAVDILFPDRTLTPLPPSLSWEKYTGRYYHPAYLNMTLELGEVDRNSGAFTLKADRTSFTWQTLAEFKHVSGEYWIMYSRLAHAPGSRVLEDMAAVEFRIGVDGEISSLGVEWRDTFGNAVDGWIWYDRVD